MFAYIRETTQAGVLRLVSIFSGLSTSEVGLSTGGIACCTDSAAVVTLAVPDIFHVKAHFRLKRLFATLIEEKVYSKST